MAHFRIKDGLYSVGVLNPTLEVFDIVMRTEGGTSYNAYVVKGEKTALIDTCHHSFFEEYAANIAEVAALGDIDYIILNHTEPDHSGALALLADRCKNAKIVCTRAASVYLKAITNDAKLEYTVVKDGDSVSLGGLELRFVTAPFLHWPDTMFTYCPELAAVFTCDFLGAHYCEPNVIDTAVGDPEGYKAALKYYYGCIMSPFAPFVRAGLDKLNALKFDTVCTSHGPVLTAGGRLGCALEGYAEWSRSAVRGAKRLPVFYCSAYGYTRKLAYAAVDEIRKSFPDAETEAYDIIEHDIARLAEIMNGSDGFLVGSPTLNRDAVPPVWELLARVDVINSQKKPIGVFGSYGWSGEAVPAIIARLNAVHLKVVGEGLKVNFNPSPEEIAKMTEYAGEFCRACAV
ncbi:MAG: FprA family A-type flavoprotein [Clostridiales bacterium]|jgi:flavorubredoxin|nr:FprA family A-type flavoprotein [Clostridiales bacterium]